MAEEKRQKMDRREVLKRSQDKYRKKLKTYILRYRIDQDADVIERINMADNVTDYIRNLVREDIRRG